MTQEKDWIAFVKDCERAVKNLTQYRSIRWQVNIVGHKPTPREFDTTVKNGIIKYIQKTTKFALLGLFLSASAQALSLSDIRTQVRKTIHDVSTDTAVQRWGDTELNQLANIGMNEIVDTTWCLYASTSITIVTGTTFYALPDDCYVIDRVIYDGNTVLEETSINKLDMDDESWLTVSSGTPEKYFMSPDRTKIGLDPKPDKSTSMLVGYVVIASTLSADTDVPFNGRQKLFPYHQLLIYWMVGWCLTEDGFASKANVYFSLYTAGLNRMANNTRIQPNYIPTFGARRE